MDEGSGPSLALERRLQEEGYRWPAGIDEVGRGALAGPVMAAAVVLPPMLRCPPELAELNDSKQLTPEIRCRLVGAIQRVSLAWGIGEASPSEIDCLGIVCANELAMRRAVKGLGLIRPQHLMVDGLPLRWRSIPQTAVVRGDGKVLSIAAASVLAKVARDATMIGLDINQPGYAFDSNKGYGSTAHRRGILLHGPSIMHRLSWTLPGDESPAVDGERTSHRDEPDRPRFGRQANSHFRLSRPGDATLRRLSVVVERAEIERVDVHVS